jgi:predicted ATPase/DNA-binding CsgD family transcriptional regulator
LQPVSISTFDLGFLPEDASSFVGRATELGELTELLKHTRALTLCGPGGIGKSRLALRLVAAVATGYPDGAWFAGLGELRQPEYVVSQVAAAVGVDEEPGRPLMRTLADSLQDRRAILVLDNCEHLIDSCAALCKHLLASAPGLQILTTGREPLRIAAETVWHVPPLDVPPGADRGGTDDLADYDAIRLFAERATAVAPGFQLGPANVGTVAAICRAVDGLPLAIELAAAWVRALSVDQIAARLDNRLALLIGANRGVPARQQAVRATLDWSFDLLAHPEQVLLRRLSALAGWSLEMAEQVCAADAIEAAAVVDLLTALADKSLVEAEPDGLGAVRYRMLDTVREYAADHLARAGEAASMQAGRRDYVLHEMEQAADIGMAQAAAPWSERVEVFRRFDLESANMREVLGGCVADRDVATGLRMCTASRPVWLVRGTFAEGAGWYDALLGLPGAGAVPASVRGPALVGRAQLALASGSDRAADLAEAGLALCRAADVQHWVATAVNLLTEVALHAGLLDDAAARADEALGIARIAGDQWSEGYALGTKAAVAARQGRLEDAERLGRQSLAIMRAIEQLWGAARTMLGLGDLAWLRGEPAAARDYYHEALDVLREVGARPEIARCLAGLGRIALGQSDPTTARRHLGESLQLSYASGSRIGIARGLELTALLCALEGYPQAAVQLAGAATALRADAHFPPIPAARTQQILDAAGGLDPSEVHRLWLRGQALTSPDALRLALADPALDMGSNRLAAAGGPRVSALTRREREVVTLIAASRTNLEIAAELVISRATVARHVANILAKLGFRSRAQVAAWASAEPRQGMHPPDRRRLAGAEERADRLALVDTPDGFGERRRYRDHPQLRPGADDGRQGVGADDLAHQRLRRDSLQRIVGEQAVGARDPDRPHVALAQPVQQLDDRGTARDLVVQHDHLTPRDVTDD